MAAAGQGLEPQFTPPEGDVLPLHQPANYTAVFTSKILRPRRELTSSESTDSTM